MDCEIPIYTYTISTFTQLYTKTENIKSNVKNYNNPSSPLEGGIRNYDTHMHVV